MNNNINSVFRALRKQGLVARQNFCCCQGCALSMLSQQYNAAEEKPNGYAFFHRQAGERLREEGCVYVSYGVFARKRPGRSALDVAKTIIETCKAAGCPVDWNGSADTQLLIWRDENTRRAYAARRLGAQLTA